MDGDIFLRQKREEKVGADCSDCLGSPERRGRVARKHTGGSVQASGPSVVRGKTKGFNPHFNKSSFAQSLASVNIGYVHCPQLGGKPARSTEPGIFANLRTPEGAI